MAAANLQIAITNFDEKDAIQNMARLDDLLNSVVGFHEFLNTRKDERDHLEAQRLADSMNEAEKNLFFIDNYIKKHLLDAKNASFLILRDQINVALTRRNHDELDKASTALQEFVQSNQLLSEYGIIMALYDKSFGSTDKTAIALIGPKTDMVLLFNTTPTAPSIVKDLAGNFIFLTGKASLCFAQSHMDEDRVWFLDRKILGQGARDVRHNSEPCELSRVNTTIDIVAFQRAELLKRDSNYVSSLLNLLQNDAFRKYDAVSEAEYKDTLQGWKHLSDTIASEVENNQRKGFGVLVVTDKTLPICFVSSRTRNEVWSRKPGRTRDSGDFSTSSIRFGRPRSFR